MKECQLNEGILIIYNFIVSESKHIDALNVCYSITYFTGLYVLFTLNAATVMEVLMLPWT